MWPMGKGESPDYFLPDLLCSWEGQWTLNLQAIAFNVIQEIDSCRDLYIAYIWFSWCMPPDYDCKSLKWFTILHQKTRLHPYVSLSLCRHMKRVIFPSPTVTAEYRSDIFGFLLLSCKWISYIITLSAFVTVKRIIAKHNFNNTIVKKT